MCILKKYINLPITKKRNCDLRFDLQFEPSQWIHKDGDVAEYIKNSDVVIAYSGSSSLVFALAQKKPIIVCNFYDLEADLFQEKGVVLECKNKSMIIPSIEKIFNSNPITDEKIDRFIEEFFYKLDGRASERIGDAILNLLKKR